jgi:hypothetical protein
MLVSCSKCAARVDGRVEKAIPIYYRDEFGGSTGEGYRLSLLICPSCNDPVVGREELLHTDDSQPGMWSEVKRVWPNPESGLDASIPRTVRVSLEEACRCLSAGTYTASVVMSGRALEAVARHFHLGEKNRLMLAKGLDELHENKKIDERLYLWGKELHEHRNLAAHASDKTFSREDAEDLYEFVNAICDYLFVLQDRYDRFMRRKGIGPTAVAHGIE